jgi:hypothetical protein
MAGVSAVFIYGDQAVPGNTNATVSASGSVLSVNLATAVDANTAVSLQLKNIRNPYYVQSPDAFQVQTKDSAGGVIDQNLSVAATAITKGSFSGLSVTAEDREISKSDSYTFTLTYGHPVPVNGYLKIEFDSDYDLSSAYLVSPTDRYTYEWSTGRNYVLLKLKEPVIANTSDTIVLGSVKNPSFVQQTDNLQFTSLSTDATANAVIDQTSLTGLVIVGGKLTGVSVSAANNIVTETSNYTINFTTKNPMSLDPSIEVTFDSDFDISGATFVSGTVDGDTMVTQSPALTINETNHTVTLALDMDITNSTAVVSFVLSGIVNPSYEQSVEFDITTQYGGNDIDITDSAAKPTVTIAAGTIASASVTPATTEVSESGNYTFAFTLPHTLSTGGYLRIIFDSDYVLTNTNCQTSGYSLSKGSNYVLLQRTGASLTGSQSVVLGSVKNPSYVQTTDSFTMRTEDSANNKIDGTTISGITTTTGALTSLSLTPVDSTVANTTTYTIAFTTDHAIVQNGKVEVTFDSDYTLTGVASTDVSGNSGSTVAISSNKMTITLGTAVAAATSVSLQVANIVNPAYVQTTDSFTFKTMNASSGLLDQGSASGVTTTAGTFTGVSVSSTYYTAGKTDVSYTFNFTYAHNVAESGYLRIDFDSDYDTSSVAVAHADYTKQEAGTNYVILKLLTAKTKGTVESVVLSNIKNPGYAQSVTFDITSKNTSNYVIDTVTTPSISIVPASLTSLSRSSTTYVATETGTYTFGFTTFNAIPAGGKVEITFDSDYTLTSVVSGSVSGNSGSTAAVSGSTVVITIGTEVSASTVVSLSIANIKNTGAQSTDSFSILTKNASGYSLDQGTVSGVTITTGSLTSLSTTPVHTEVSYSTNYTFAFTVAHSVPVGGYVKIQFDSDYDISSAYVVGDYTISKGTNYILLQRNVSALSGAVSIELRNITNPSYVQTTDTFVITTMLANSNSIDVGSAPAITTTAGTLTSTTVTPATTVVAESTSYTLNFTADHAIGENGIVEVTLDSDCDLSLVFPSDVSGNEGATVAVSGSKLIITLGEAVASGVSESLVISNITNPSYVKETSTFFVQTKNSSGGVLDEVTAASFTTTTGTLGSTSVTPTSLVSGATTSYAFDFTPAHAVPVNGYLRIDFDTSYNLSDPGAVVMSSTTACDITLRGSGYLLIKFSTSGLTAGVEQTIEIANIVNPPNVKSLSFTLTTKNASLYDIDTVDVSGLATTAGSLSSVSLSANTYVVSEYATYTAVFTTANPIPAGGKVEITFDSDYDLTSVESSNVTGNSGATVEADGSTLVVTIGTAIAKSTQVSLAISNIKNPVYVQTTDSFAVQSTTADDAVIDTATMSALSITTGALSGMSVTATSAKISDVTSYTFNFTVQHAVPADGFIRIQFDSNYSLGSAYLDTASFYSLTKGSDYLKFKTVSAISAGQAVSIPIAMIANPSYVYTVSNFQVKTMTAVTTSQQIMDSGEIGGVTLTAGTLSNISVTAASTEVSALTSYTFSFKTENSIAASTGKVVIQLDGDYDLTSIGSSDVSGNSGATVAVSGSNLVITLGTAVSSSTSVSLTVSNIKNPSYVQTAGDVIITSKVQVNSVDYDKDSGTLSPGTSITSGSFTGVSISAASQVAGETSTYTFGFTPAHDVPAGGFIYIVFASGYDVSGGYFISSTGTGEYAVSSLTTTMVTLNVTSALGTGEGQSITLGGVVNPQFVDSLACTIRSANSSAGVIDVSDTPELSITPAPLSVLSIDGASYVARDLTSYTITFTAINPIDAGGKVELTFDSDYDLTSVESGNVSGNSGSTVSVSSNVLTITLGTAVAADESSTLVVSNIRNPGVQTTDSLGVVTRNSSGNQLDYGSVSGKAITAGTLTSLSATAGTTEVGESGSYTFGFTPTHTVPINGYIRIQFDSNYTLSGTTVATSGYALSETGSNYVLLKTGSALSSAVSIQLNSIVNPSFVSSSLSSFSIQTQLSNNQVIDTGTAAAITTTSGALSSMSVSAASLGVSTTTSYTFNFTTDHAIAAGGQFVVTFDSDYDLTSVQEIDVSGNTDAYISSVSGSTITVVLGTAIAKATSASLVIANIKNPSYVQTTDNFSLKTKNSSGYIIDEGTLGGVTTVSGIITISSITSSSYIAGASNTQYTFTFAPTNAVSAGGYLRIDFDVSDSAYDASSAIVSAGSSTFVIPTGGATKNYVNMLLNQDIEAGVQQTLQLSGITNPTYVKSVTIRLTTKVSTGEKVDTSDYGPISITAAPLSGLSLIMGSTTALDTSRHTFSFTIVNAIDAGGKVEITMDSDYTLTSVASGDVSGNSGSTVAVSGSKLIVTLGTAVSSGGEVALAIDNIKNPGVQTTDAYAIVTKNSSGSQLDQGSIAGKTITAGALTSLSATAGTTEVGESGSYTFGFTPTHTVPINGYIRIQFDSNYTLSGTTVATSGYALSETGSNYVLLKTGSALSSAVSIQLNSIVNPSFVSSSLSSFSIQTQLSNNQVIDTGTAAAITTTSGALSSMSVSAASLGVSTTTSYTFNFTTDHAIAAGGQFVVTFDSDYDLTSVQEIDVSGNTDAYISSVSGSTITVVLGTAIAKATSASLVIANIKNPSYVQTTDNFSLKTKNSSGYIIDEGTLGGVTTTAGTLTSVSGTPSSYAAGSTTQYVFNFMPAHNVASGGYVKIAFDSEYDIASSYLISPSANYSISSKTDNIIVLNVSQDIVASSSQSITIGSIVNPGRVKTGVTFTVTTCTSAGANIDTAQSASISITTGSLTSLSVTASTYTTYDMASYTFGFTTVNALDEGGKVEITFDADYDISDAVFTYGNDGASLSVSGRVATITLGTAIDKQEIVSLTISEIRNPGVQTTDSYSIVTKDSTDTRVDTGTISGKVITGGSISSASVTAGSTQPSVSTTYTFAFTPDHVVPAGGYVRITFDSDYTLDYVSVQTAGYATSSGAGYVLLTNTSGADLSGSLSIVLLNVKNPASVKEPTDNFYITTMTSNQDTIDTTSVTGITMTPSEITVYSMSTVSTEVSALTTYTLSVTPINTIPIGGKVVLTFDSDYTLTNIGSGDVSGNSATASVSGNVLTITLGEMASSGTALTLIISNVQNPSYVQTTDAFSVVTKDASGYKLDTCSITGTTITEGQLTTLSATPADTTLDTTTSYLFQFTPEHTIPLNGYVKITFDSDFDLSSAYSGSSNYSVITLSSNYILLKSLAAQSSAQSLQIINIKNPSYVQTTDDFSIVTQNSNQKNIDKGTAAGITTTAGVLTAASVGASSSQAGASTSYTFNFTTVHAIAAGGKVEISFDSDYTLTSVGVYDVSGNSNSTVSVSGSKLTVTIGTAISAAESVSLTIANIKNPSYVQTTSAFTLNTMNSSGGLLDTGSISGITLTAGSLSSVSVTPTSTEVSKSTDYAFSFTAEHSIPSGGYIEIEFDSAYDLTSSIVLTSGYSLITRGSNYLTLQSSAEVSGSVSISLRNIVNPPYVATTSSFTIITQTADGDTIDMGTCNGVTTTAASLTSASVSADLSEVSAQGDYTFVITPQHDIPSGGRIRITFDSDYTVSGVGTSDVACNGGTATVQVSSKTLIITLSYELSGGTEENIVISNIKNPSFAQTTNNFTIVTRDDQDRTIDQGSASGIEITAGTMTSVSVSADSLVAGYTTNYTFNFTPTHAISSGGYVVIDFDSDYDASSGYVVSPLDTFSLLSRTANKVTLNVLKALPAGTAQTVTLGTIVNPGSVKQVTFTITTENSNQNTVDTVVSSAISTQAAPMTAMSVSAVSRVALDTTSYTFGFTTTNAIESGGTISITFDSEYTLTSATYTSGLVGGSTSLSATLAISGSQIILTTATDVGTAQTVSVTLAGIKNPGVQTVDSYALLTKDSSGRELDQGTISGLSITAGTLTSLSVSAGSTEISKSTTYTFGFKVAHTVPSDGYVKIAFDSDYSFDSATVLSEAYSISEVGSNYILLKRSAQLIGTNTLQLGNVINPAYVQTTDSFTITTQLSDNKTIDTGTVTGVGITAGALTSVSASATETTISAVSSYTFGFTAAHAVEEGGRVAITFDADFDLSSVSVGSSDVSGSGTPAIESIDGSVISVVLSSGISASTAASLTISNVVNPAYVQTTSSFSLKTKNSSGAVIDEGSAAGVTTTAGTLTGISVVSSSSIAGARTDYTFGFTPAHAVGAGGYLRIDLNSQYDASISYVMSPTATFEISDKSTNYIVVKALSALAAGTAYSVRIGNIDNPGRSMDVTFTLTTKTSSSANIDTGTSSSLHITPAPMESASISATSLIATETATYTLNFVPVNTIDEGGRVELTFDEDYDLSSVTSVSGYDASVAVSDNVLIFTLNSELETGEACSFVIPNVKNPGAKTTDDFALNTKDSSGTSLDEGSIDGKAITAGSLSGLSVSATSYEVMGAGESTTYTFNFTCSHTIPASGYVRIGFDSDYNLANAVNLSAQYVISTKGDNYLLIKTTQARSGACSIQLSGIRNPSYVKTTDNFSLATQLASQLNIDTGSIAGVTTTSGSLSGISVTATNLKIAEESSYTFSFTADHAIAVGGKVAITFDADYDLTAVTSSSVSGNSGATVAVSGNDLVVTLGEQVFSAGSVSLTVSDITNPSYVQTVDSFAIKTENADDGLIDEGSVAGVTLEPGTLGSVGVSATNLQVNGESIYTFTFTPAHAIPSGGYIKIDIDDDYDISSAYLYLVSGYSFAKNTTDALFTLQPTSAKPAGTAITISIAGIVNPPYGQITDDFTINTQSANQSDIDSGTADGVEITAGQLSGVSVTSSSSNYTVGEETSYRIAFTTVNAIGVGGQIKVTFDSDYGFSLDGSVSGNSGATASVSNNVVTITLGTAVSASEAVNLTLGTFTNPGYAQETDSFSVKTYDSEGNALDSGTGAGLSISSGSLTGLSVSASSLNVSDSDTKLTFGFNAAHTIPLDGYIKITLDSDYSVTSPYIKSSSGASLTLLTEAGSQEGYLLFRVDSEFSGALSVTVGGITNPPYAQTTSSFAVTTMYSGEQAIDTGTISGLSIASGALTVSSVSCVDNYAGATTDYTVNFTAAHAIPTTSKIEIVFDSNYTLTGAALSSPSGSLTISGSTLSISLGSAVSASSAVSLVMSGIVNPAYSQTTDSFNITVKNADGNTVDAGTYAGIAILPAEIEFTTPAAGDVYSVGDSETIKWQVANGSIARSTSHWLAQFSADAAFSSPITVHEGVASVDANNNLYFTLSVDTSMVSQTAYLRVSCTDTNYTDVIATSGQFSVRPVAGFVGFVAPLSTSKWAIGSESAIEWSTQGAVNNNFKIEYIAGGVTTTVYEEGVTASGSVSKSSGDNWYEDKWSYTWTVPQADNLPDTGVVIKVTNLDNTIVTASSSAFEISTAYIEITSPGEGVTWVRTETNDITWEGMGDSGTNFSIEYYDSTNEASSTIYSGSVERTLSGGKWMYSYSWTVDSDLEPTDTATLTITNLDNTEIADTSAAFSINASGKLEVTSPAEGDKWVVGAKYTITWTSEGQALSSSSIRITYTATGISETLITNSTTNSGSKEFTCPSTTMSNVKIHLYQINGDVDAESGAFSFVSVPTLQFVSPAANDSWVASLTKNIQWTGTGYGLTQKVVVTYSTDGGSTYPNTIFDYTTDSFEESISAVTSGTVTTYTLPWEVPTDYSTNVKIRVQDKGIMISSTALSVSSGKFSITAPSATLSAPTGGEEWISGTEHDIVWSETGSLGKDIKISYSIDGGSTYPYTIFQNSDGDDEIYAEYISVSDSTFTYHWTVPDTISTRCRVKVEGLTNGGSGSSLANFSIKLPTITITSPVSGDLWAVYDSGQTISWTTVGNISEHLKIEYFKDASTSKVIVADTDAAMTSYSWDITEDFEDYVSESAWIKITDLDSEDTFGQVISATSGTFELSSPGFSINVPTASLVTGNSYTITWEGVGMYAECSNESGNTVLLQYGVGDDPDWVTIVSSTQNDGSYENWTVPDEHSSQVRFRITSNKWSFVSSTSDTFKIIGSFAFTSPDAGTKLFVGHEQMVEWTTNGTINKVNLYYSKNGGSTWNSISSNITNNGYYEWTIPDAVLADRSPNSSVYFKVEDATDTEVYARRQLTISYYKVIWNVIDADGLVGDMDALSVYSLDVTDDNAVWEDRTGLSCAASIKSVDVDADDITLYYYPDHLYQTTWSRDAYLDATVQPSPWTADEDGKEFTVTLATKEVTKTRTVYSSVTYDASTDVLSIQCWLQEEEKLLTETAGLQGCYIVIYDDADNAIKTFEYDASEADSSGVFWTKWADPGLETGTSYFARIRIQYDGAFHYGGSTFEITTASAIEDIAESVSAGVVAITSAISESSEEIKAKIEEQASKTQSVVTSAKESVESKVEVIGAETQSAVSAAATSTKETVSRESSSRILNGEAFIKTGNSLKIRYQTDSGLAPEIDVYDPKNIQRVTKGQMSEMDDTGVYEYEVTFLSGWGEGSFSIVCSESTYGTIDGITIEVVNADLEDINSAAVVSMSQLSNIDTDQMKDLTTSIGIVSSSIERIVGTMNDLGSMSGKLSELTDDIQKTVFDQLSVASEKMREIASKQNVKIDKMIDVSKKGAEDVQYLKKKTLEIKATAELTNDIIQRANDKPITKTWLEPGSILMNAVVVNPSSTKTQTATLKAYLPVESKPEDIVNLGDLSVAYDIQENLYYVFKEFELSPGEMAKRQIELKDIWVISEKELNAALERANDMLQDLKGSSFYSKALPIRDSIQTRVSEIIDAQKKAMDALPDTHIAVYRSNMKTFNLIKDDLARIEAMLLQAKPAVGVALNKVFVKTSWWIILMVVLSLGALSFGLFIMWHKQAKAAQSEEKSGKPEEL